VPDWEMLNWRPAMVRLVLRELVLVLALTM
jgi:hypothetical protein